MDVLRALKTDERDLFPAPCRIEQLPNAVAREQEAAFLRNIAEASGRPVVVHADGGIGKSIFATRIKLGLPPGSFSVLYDCFGNGQYRSVTGYRHRHKDALVQIANELAGVGLCHPLIPTPHAEPSDYMRAFLYRLKQSVASLRTSHPDALLCIVVDAADNAQMAAEEIGETRSFVRDLVREELPEGLRLVVLARTHRVSTLDLSPLALSLHPFSRTKTARHLRQAFPNAIDEDVEEFHRLSSQNPRVQSLALSRSNSLSQILRLLGPNPTTVEQAIGDLLNDSIVKLRDSVSNLEKTQIDRICAGLAALRPLIPISVLASMSGVDAAAIKSFAFDLGRPLLVTGDTIQFFDEPSETWFREKFKPQAAELTAFVAGLRPLAATSGYVAAALPQLLLEAGHFTDLVALALSSEGLPETSPLERRDVELQRLQFALKASLRTRHYKEAAKLALKAGGESAGDDRQRKLIQANTDLAAVFMDADRIQEIVSRRTFGSKWVGSHHAYEAGLMSGRTELLGDARSRLRMALEWLQNWSKLSSEDREREEMQDPDIAELAIASFNIHGAEACARSIRGWRPRSVSFRGGCLVARRFVDHARYQDLNDLAVAAGNDLYLLLAIILELGEAHKYPPKVTVERALRLIQKPGVKLKISNAWRSDDGVVPAAMALVEACCALSISEPATLVTLLTRYLPAEPPRCLASRFEGLITPHLRAYCLSAALSGKQLALIDLAHPELRAELEKKNKHHDSRNAQEFKEVVGALLPWHALRAETFLKLLPKDSLADAVAKARSESAKAEKINYREESGTSNEIARVWLEILVLSGSADSECMKPLVDWIAALKTPLYTTTLTRLARLCALQDATAQQAISFATSASVITRDIREDAHSKSDGYIDVARSILTVSKSEAAAYFNAAVEVASRIGDENIDRWAAMLDLADRAARKDRPTPEAAYRLSRCAELSYDYVVRDKHFDWNATVRSIAALCPCSTFAILSRWRDRRFGWDARLLPVAVEFLIARGSLDPKVGLALIPIRAQWQEGRLIGPALNACIDQPEKRAMAEFLYRYMSLEAHAAQTWRGLRDVLNAHNVGRAGLDELIAFTERQAESRKTRDRTNDGTDLGTAKSRSKREWDDIFAAIDLGSANDIAQAYGRFRAGEPPFYNEEFFKQAITRVKPGREAELISAVSEVTNFDLYELRGLLSQIPEDWKSRLAVKSALAATLKAFCRRFCMAITKSRYYEVLPFKLACELSGVAEAEVVDVVLTAIGEASELVGAGRLFTLVGLLAVKLSEEEALEALSFGLDLFDVVLEDKDGDGPWSEALLPPTDMEAAVAGYVWGALASPEAALRWEGAHAVRGLCTLSGERVVAELVDLAKASKGGAFADARLHFYDLHGQQWLLLGLARAASENPQLVAAHAAFLLTMALDGNPHVLIRRFAAQAALTLLDCGMLEGPARLRERLLGINASPFPIVSSKRYERVLPEPEARAEGGDDRFYFGIDMGPYWFDRLGSCFAKSQVYIEREALRVIRDDWHYGGSSRWDEDERARRKIFKEGETYHSHGSYPRTDDLRFYLSYHAMMIVAGKLLATMPVHQSDDRTENELEDWLSDHALTRHDNRWVADRRDPVPLEWPDWKAEGGLEDWRGTIARSEFDRVQSSSDGKLNIWGWWTAISGKREETIHVRSALVSRPHSEALLRALQTATNPHNYLIPNAEDDEKQVDAEGFQPKGWIIHRDRRGGLDDRDPWAGEIGVPGPIFAPYVIDTMKLGPDTECRNWRVEGCTQPAASCQIWGHFRDKDDEDDERESGERIQAEVGFITGFLREMDMDLILKVEIERRFHKSRYESFDDELGHIPPNARIFLLKGDGTLASL